MTARAAAFSGAIARIEFALLSARSQSPWFARVSPRGEVPVLRHEEISLYDSAVIGAYIDETWAEPPLLPTTAKKTRSPSGS